MLHNDDHQSERSLLPEDVRKGPTLGAREGFILLFVLFNAMFCVLLLLLLQNREYAERIAVVEATATRLVVDATTGADEAARAIATRDSELQQLRFSPTPPRIAALPTRPSDRNPSTPTAEGTLSPTTTPSPTTMPSLTPTRVLPSPTSTPQLPTPVPVPTDTPKPKPQPPPTRPPEPTQPPPTRPADPASSP